MNVSVLVLTYNDADRIEALLNELLAYVSNVLVIDNGSSDCTAELVRKVEAVASGRVEFLGPESWTPDNAAGGRARARNFALDRAKGDWVLILDGDEHVDRGGEGLKGLRSPAGKFAA